MLTPLAEWILKGPNHALAFVMVTSLGSSVIGEISILTGAAMTLVWLTKGTNQGIRLLLASLPLDILAAFYLQSPTPLVVKIAVTAGICTLYYLRQWRLVLMATTACTLVMMILALGLPDSLFENALAVMRNLYNGIVESVPDSEQLLFTEEMISPVFIIGLLGLTTMFCSFLGLTLGRSWQARFYNPGGFQSEFHWLKLGRADITACLVVALLVSTLSKAYITWLGVIMFPMLVAGTALFHYWAGQKKLMRFAYIMYYVGLVLIGPFRFLVVLLAVLDTMLDIRHRLAKND